LALGFILILFGNATNNEEMFTAGKLFVIFGFAAFAISLLVLLAIAKIR
jgi:membrane protein implicated in regulation of membrane protease activity